MFFFNLDRALTASFLMSIWCADLRDADLSGANLHGANLGRTRLDGADLRDADLRFSSLHGASLRARTSVVRSWTGPIYEKRI